MDPSAFMVLLSVSGLWKFDGLSCGLRWSARGCKDVFNVLCRWKEEPNTYSGRWCVRGNRRPTCLRSPGAIRSLVFKLREKHRNAGNTTDFLRAIGRLAVTFSVAQVKISSSMACMPSSQTHHRPDSGRGCGNGRGCERGLVRSSTNGRNIAQDRGTTSSREHTPTHNLNDRGTSGKTMPTDDEDSTSQP
jgi:hypothetical protein